MRAEFIPADFYHLPLISHVAAGLALEITRFDGLVVRGVDRDAVILLHCVCYYFSSTQRICKLYVKTHDQVSHVAYLEGLC